MAKNKSFTEGPLFSKIFLFALPIMLSAILQMSYTMADKIVVGRFSGDPNALGAVGSTTALVNLTTQLLLGISTGSSVVVAQSFGAKREKEVSDAVHTAMTVALVGGIMFSLAALLCARPMLVLMGTNVELLDTAVLYFQIMCLGIPAAAIYNYGAAILRSVGDSRIPLIILGVTGLVNVVFNLVFVLALGMSADGVAISTIISQYLSAIWVTCILVRRKNECYSLSRKKYCFNKALCKRIMRLGIPAGIQSSMFGISNVLMTSGINTLPLAAIKANPIASSIDSLTSTTCNAFFSASITFIGQNYGARKPDRIKKAFIYSILQATVITLVIAAIELIFVDKISYVFIDTADPMKEEIAANVRAICTLMLPTYFIGAVMDTVSGAVKALGYSLSPMVCSLTCICGLRIIWIFFIFPLETFNSISGLFLIYPITWTICAASLFVLWLIAQKRVKELAVAKE